MDMSVFADGDNIDFLVSRKHLMLQFPACSPGEFGDDRVAVAQESDVEVDVIYRLTTWSVKGFFIRHTSTLTSRLI